MQIKLHMQIFIISRIGKALPSHVATVKHYFRFDLKQSPLENDYDAIHGLDHFK